MRIKHISILDAAREIKKRDCESKDEYVMRVNLSYNPSHVWKRYFASEWRRMSFNRRRQVKMDRDELKILLSRGDNIQNYIDSIKKVVSVTNNLVERHGEKTMISKKTAQDLKSDGVPKRYRIKNNR